MSVILELMVFFANCLSSIFTILENTYLGEYSMLSIVCSMGYISITFWGIFQLLESDTDKEVD